MSINIIVSALVAAVLLFAVGFAVKLHQQMGRIYTLRCGGVVVSEDKGFPQYLDSSGSYIFRGGSYKPDNGERCSITYRASP